MSARQSVIITPIGSVISPECSELLDHFERQGITVWRVRGYSAIDVGRSQLATDAISQGFQETIWIDSDISCEPKEVELLMDHDLPIVCGLYPKKGKRELAVHALPEIDELVFGKRGGLTEVQYAGFGFMRIRCEVYHKRIIRFLRARG